MSETNNTINTTAVTATKDWLTWEIIKGANTAQNNVTTNLILPSEGLDGANIEWKSSNSAVLNVTSLPNIGDITANRTSDEAINNINITATISKGSVNETKTFAIDIPARNDFAKRITHAPNNDNYNHKNWTISDFNVLDFGAKTEEMIKQSNQNNQNNKSFCNRIAFQAAIDAAYYNGGGVVYAPAGTYAFRTETTVNQISKGINYEYKVGLNLRSGVQIRGDWSDPDNANAKNNGKINGTILAVYCGHNTERINLYVPSDAYEAQTGSGRLDNVDDRFINMSKGTGVTNLSVWYPEQDINNIVAYPWTFYQVGGDSATIDSVTLVNAYCGFISAPSELHYVLNCRMTALKVGVRVHTCTDIGRVESVKIDYKYWANSGLPNAPAIEQIKAYTRTKAVGFEMHRSDWEYVSGLFVSGYKTGMWVGKEPGFDETPNAQLYGLNIDDCETGLEIEAVNPYGLLISNSQFGGDRAVYFSNQFDTSVQFNGVDFKGQVVSDSSGGVISFESCTFDNLNGYDLNLNSGNVLLAQCVFKNPNEHFYLAPEFALFKSINSGYNFDRATKILNYVKSGDNTLVNITDDNEDKKYMFESIPQNIKTNIDVNPKAATNAVLRLDLCRENAFNDVSVANLKDISAQLQTALDYIKANYNGGTVYLPAGRYKINSPIIIPEGVELRGSWDVQHHTQGGGTALFTEWNGENSNLNSYNPNGTPLIRLAKNAGITGLNIVQANITSENMNVSRFPFLIQGIDTGVYAINITIPIADKGIDFASFDTSGHYVDYLAGSLLTAGIWVGGGAKNGFIRNMQFNPHYTARHPDGNQGYPQSPKGLQSYIQANASALKFADVQGETIFNNFVYGSINGIHFLKDSVTNKCPGEIIVIGHGSDGCTFAFSVENADENTKIIGINSELVNTAIKEQAVRSYVRMGYTPNDTNINPQAKLILFNTAFWGSPTTGAFVNNGIVIYNQVNFQAMGKPAVSVKGGEVHVYNSYFRAMNGKDDNLHAYLCKGGKLLELTNNYYSGSLHYVSEVEGGACGADFGKE